MNWTLYFHTGDFGYDVKCQTGSAGTVFKVTQPLWNKLSCSWESVCVFDRERETVGCARMMSSRLLLLVLAALAACLRSGRAQVSFTWLTSRSVFLSQREFNLYVSFDNSCIHSALLTVLISRMKFKQTVINSLISMPDCVLAANWRAPTLQDPDNRETILDLMLNLSVFVYVCNSKLKQSHS